MASQYQIVHLSDIHFRQERNGDVVLLDDVRNELLVDAHRLREELGDADAVVVTGDIAYSGKREEYEQAGDWLSELCKAVGCPEESVHVIPGNHDIDWSEITQIVKDLHELIADVEPNKVDNFVSSRFYGDPAACGILLNKFNNYREFANRYGKDFESCEIPYWTQDISALGLPTLRLVGLNTVLFSDEHDAKGRLALGQNQYILRRDNDVEYLALLHHPPEWFKDSQQSRNYLENRARVWLMGHEHTLRVNTSKNLQDFERLEIHAGATNPPAEDGYEFRYNWLTLSVCSVEVGRHLVVALWPRVWTFASTEFVADTNILQGQEHKDFYLVLPEAVTEMVTDEIEEAEENHMVPSPADPDVEELSVSENEHHVTRDNKDFRRLQFLFWKKLDRSQRVHVLAELGMLPDDFQMQPVWLRRGLDAARYQRKLYELWDSVMRYLPDDQKESNPFSP